MSSASPVHTPAALKFKLSLMMFLQFVIWGAWFEIGFSFIPALKFEQPWMNALVFGAFNIGAIVALFFSTQFADRNFAAEKFLSFSHLIGGLAIGGLFFLLTTVGLNQGELSSVRIDGRGPTATSGVGALSDKTRVVVDNITTDKKADEFWTTFDKDLKTYQEAHQADAKQTKVSDPRFVQTFIVTSAKPGEIVGDAKTPLAPFWPFLILMLVHSLFYVPTISITNSIAFASMKEPEKEFGPIRVWGTIGWIVAAWPFIFILLDWSKVPALGNVGFTDWIGTALGSPLSGAALIKGQSYVFIVAGIASLLLAAFSLSLPNTPPKPASGVDKFAWFKAMKYLAKPFLLVLFLVTFIDAAVHQSFFFWTPDFLIDRVKIPANWATPVMKIGQIAEIITMLFLGYVLKSLGWRTTMIIGVLGHAARFAVFAYMPDDKYAIIIINVLHGICYAFFFATVYIFVDKFFPKDIRSSAQGLFNVLIVGVGPFVANFICTELKTMYTVNKVLDYSAVFQYSMGAGLVAALLLLFFFHPPKDEVKE
ncbi:MAG TPA: MFS transporter [Gemmatales bacterium]|nr:MFS transporter [Gemmatales bacterium]